MFIEHHTLLSDGLTVPKSALKCSFEDVNHSLYEGSVSSSSTGPNSALLLVVQPVESTSAGR